MVFVRFPRRVPAFLLASFALFMLAAVPAQAVPIVVGQPADANNGNCFPFGCGYSGLYQQVYTNGEFLDPILITGLEFYNTSFNSNATAMNDGNWDISLSTTSADWNTLSGVFASNIGADNTLVFSGNLSQPWTFGNTLVIPFSTPFSYDPTGGNLLMTVNATGTSARNGSIFFDANGFNGLFNGNTIMGRVYLDGSVNVNSGYGLITGFESAAAPVPEPGATGTLVLVGAGALACLRRRLKRRRN